MRYPSELTHPELVDLVSRIQSFLYLDMDGQGQEYLNPDKPCSGSELVDYVVGLLGEQQLVPDRPIPWVDDGPSNSMASRYLIFDLAEWRLLATDVFESYSDAAEIASLCNDVLILALSVPSDPCRSSKAVHEPCECEAPGYFYSTVPGVIAHLENGTLAPGASVERCNLCQRYPNDSGALAELRRRGIA